MPKAGELIIYDADATNELRIKVGDGTSTVGELNYVVDNAALKRYVDTEIASLVNAAPETLDTLGEVAAAIAENEEVVEALNAAIGNKLDTEVYQEKILEIDTNLNNKVDKIAGKGLSSADFTAEEKAKLAGIEEGANNFVLQTASTTRPGGVMIGNNITVADGVISVTEQNIIAALGYTPSEALALDTSLTIAGAAADAKAVGDAFDALETVIALDPNADGNIELKSYIQAEEGDDGYTRLDSSLTVAGMAPDSKAVGDAINLRMLANAVIPVAQGGTGAIDKENALINLGAVSKSGDTMTGTLTAPQVNIINSTNAYPRIVLSCSDGTNNGKAQYSVSASDGKAYIVEWANGSTYYESYYLPAPATNLTANKTYNILTTKNAVSIAQGGTGATTAAAARTALGAVSKAGDTITGTLNLTKTTDATATADNDVALIIGDRASTHIIIDNNEIIAKSSGTTGGNLGLGQKADGCFVQINGYLKFGTANYGTTLPAAGNSGRVFLLKV